mgnify:CR=1 FL=1
MINFFFNFIKFWFKMQLLANITTESSEFRVYMNTIYCEAGLYEKALDHLERNKNTILDRLYYDETRGDLFKFNL